MSQSLRPDVSVRKLQRSLQSHACPKTKAWFDGYLKGAISYRGVPIPKVRELACAQWAADGYGAKTLFTQLEFVGLLLSQAKAEDKFAGILLTQEKVLGKETAYEVLNLFEEAFESGAFFDWSTVDWCCTRVLGPLLVLGPASLRTRVARWTASNDVWKRRAAIVSQRNLLAVEPQEVDRAASIIKKLLPDEERFIQTGIGWYLADLSKRDPEYAARLFMKHFKALSPEVIRRHAKHLPQHKEWVALKKQTNTRPNK